MLHTKPRFCTKPGSVFLPALPPGVLDLSLLASVVCGQKHSDVLPAAILAFVNEGLCSCSQTIFAFLVQLSSKRNNHCISPWHRTVRIARQIQEVYPA